LTPKADQAKELPGAPMGKYLCTGLIESFSESVDEEILHVTTEDLVWFRMSAVDNTTDAPNVIDPDGSIS